MIWVLKCVVLGKFHVETSIYSVDIDNLVLPLCCFGTRNAGMLMYMYMQKEHDMSVADLAFTDAEYLKTTDYKYCFIPCIYF